MTKIYYTVMAFLFTSILLLVNTPQAWAQKDPVPINKGTSFSYSKIGGSYDDAQPFHPVLRDDKLRVPARDRSGKIIKDSNGKVQMRDSTFQKEIAVLAAVRKGEKWGFINDKGQTLVPFKYDFVRDFSSDGFAAVGVNADPFPKYGFVDHLGKEIIPLKYNGVGDFNNNIASFSQIDTSDFTKPTTGFIDKTGKVIVPVSYDQAHDFSDGMAAVSRNGRWGFINSKGRLIIPMQYEEVYDFNEGLAKVYSRLKWGFIDKTGRVIINFEYQDPIGNTRVNQDGSNDGKFINGIARVRSNNREGWIDKRNVTRIPFIYTQTQNFNDGLAAIQQAGKWGYITPRGNLVIPCQYIEVMRFQEGLAPVRIGTSWGFIDKSGTMKIAPKYDAVDQGFLRGIAKVEKGGKVFYIDQTGKEY